MEGDAKTSWGCAIISEGAQGPVQGLQQADFDFVWAALAAACLIGLLGALTIAGAGAGWARRRAPGLSKWPTIQRLCYGESTLAVGRIH